MICVSEASFPSAARIIEALDARSDARSDARLDARLDARRNPRLDPAEKIKLPSDKFNLYSLVWEPV
jgi:hypothetical protein